MHSFGIEGEVGPCHEALETEENGVKHGRQQTVGPFRRIEGDRWACVYCGMKGERRFLYEP
jgi:hypothetical protein